MANEEIKVHIDSWPIKSAKLEHKIDQDKSFPISLSFEKNPANVIIHTSQEKPLYVDMNMKLSAKETIPLCIKLCEPICARSNYRIGIDIFDRPVASVSLKGETRIYNCREYQEKEPVCVEFNNLKSDQKFEKSIFYQDLKFIPLGTSLTTSLTGDPEGQIKLRFPPDGIRIEFPAPSSNITVTISNSSSHNFNFSIFSGTERIDQFEEFINNQTKEINIVQSNVTAVEITGGNNEAAIVRVCYVLS